MGRWIAVSYAAFIILPMAKAKQRTSSSGKWSVLLSDGSNHAARRIKTYKEMKDLATSCRRRGLKIVLTQGTWDMVHIGHARYLEKAKGCGDVLIVGVDSDEKVKSRKGPNRPLIPEDERLEILTHLRSVNAVFLKHLKDPKWQLVKTVKPDVLIVIKENYNSEQLKELKQFCGEVTVFDRQAPTSTSAKIRLVQISTAKKIEEELTPRLTKVVNDVFSGMW